MNSTWRLSLIGCAIAAVAATLPADAQSSTQTPTASTPTSAASSAGWAPNTYVVTSLTQIPQGQAVSHEALSIRSEATGYRLFLANSDGTTFSTPVTLTPDGIITLDSQDGAVTCYNMAMNVVSAAHHSPPSAASVFVLFGSTVVRIPLHVDAVRAAGNARTLTLSGQSIGQVTNGTTAIGAGVMIKAIVGEDSGLLHDASFDEIHYVGSTAQPIGRSQCTVVRGTPAQTGTATTPQRT